MAESLFLVEKTASGTLARAGVLNTSHGTIETPAFVPVATKATVKALTPEQVKDIGAQVVLANTYHLYLQPGAHIVKQAGGLASFMKWDGPTMTDSGGFQVFSLGAAFGKGISKLSSANSPSDSLSATHKREQGEQNVRVSSRSTFSENEENAGKLALVDNDGVTFKSYRDGSTHRFTPESSIEIQHKIGADIIFAFDECPSPDASEAYQRQAIERTHAWAKRSLAEHRRLHGEQSIYGIVQGGRIEHLRRESANAIGNMDFDGYGIGGSFDKNDIGTAVRWVNEILPKDRPRHLLGIGEPQDILFAVENGCDTFDCVLPSRAGRTGTLYTKKGKMNISNSKFESDFSPIEDNCLCYTCKNFTRAYLHHLFDAKEMLAATLSTVHNLAYFVSLTSQMRKSILDDKFEKFKNNFILSYKT